MPSWEELEKLFVNNQEFEKIQSAQSRFNPIKVMRMENMEIRHSAILAWLLDPQESHGIGDVFLKNFLAQACQGSSSLILPSSLDILHANMISAEIRVEWQNIDLLVHSPTNKWVFIVENKFWSQQSQDQLTRYIDRATSTFPSEYNVRGVFLTLNDEEPDNENIKEEQHKFVSIRYVDIVEILEQKILIGRYAFAPDVEMFLRHYLEVLKLATNQSEEQRELEVLAKKLYLEHKKAIDFIVEHGAMTDFGSAVESIFPNANKNDSFEINDKKYIYFAQNKKIVSFLPLDWKDVFDAPLLQPLKEGCQNWWHGYPIICWFQLNQNENEKQDSGKLFLIAEVGPIANAELRRALIENIEDLRDNYLAFNQRSKKDGAKYSKFFQNTTKSLQGNSIIISDVTSSEEISTAMEELLKRFEYPITRVTKALRCFDPGSIGNF